MWQQACDFGFDLIILPSNKTKPTKTPTHYKQRKFLRTRRRLDFANMQENVQSFQIISLIFRWHQKTNHEVVDLLSSQHTNERKAFKFNWLRILQRWGIYCSNKKVLSANYVVWKAKWLRIYQKPVVSCYHFM